MYRVDMIGANAVGKTTLLREALKRSVNSWLAPKTAQIQFAAQLLQEKNTVLALLLKCFFLKKAQYKVARSIIKKNSDNMIWNHPDAYDAFINAAITLTAEKKHPPFKNYRP